MMNICLTHVKHVFMFCLSKCLKQKLRNAKAMHIHFLLLKRNK